jgi:beta-alanine--pyruvate transaminase
MACVVIPFLRDRTVPATSNSVAARPAAGSGAWDAAAGPANQPVLDGAAGLVAPIGGGRKEFGKAALPGQDHAAVAERLAALAPRGFGSAILTGSHAAACDFARQICVKFHRSRGEAWRTGFVIRERDRSGLFPIARMRHTRAPESRFTRGQPAEGAERADDLRRKTASLGGRAVAACFVEPIAVWAGVLVPPQGYLERLRAICDAQRILLVFDEASCGLGRTGAAFASQSLDVTPDLIILGDALANGAQAIGAILVRDDVRDAIACSPEAQDMLGALAPPLLPACAAADAALDIFMRERLFERAARMTPAFLDAMFSLSDLSLITDIRGYGMLAAFDFAPARVPGARGREIRARLKNAGLIAEIAGDTAIVAPALTIDERQIDTMAAILRKVLSIREPA